MVLASEVPCLQQPLLCLILAVVWCSFDVPFLTRPWCLLICCGFNDGGLLLRTN